ncbi:MAG: hypothetical protein RIB65_14815 [Ilumatobacter fluminis]|uniref:hypothetical protein n=1 Tax=Ilumatobacter fluminis TaxID=467091 RepID=UPI0032EDF351
MTSEPNTGDFASNPAGWLRSAADRADTVLQIMNQPPGDGSPQAVESAAIAGRFDEAEYKYGDVGQHMIEGAAQYAGRYLAHVVRSVRELATAIDGHALLSVPTIVRSHVEFAGRAVWLVEPLEGDPADTAFERVCRMNLDLYVSKCYVRTALETLGSPAAKDAKLAREEAADQIRRRFTDPDPELKWAGVGSEANFSIGGFSYAGLTAVTKRFLKSWDHQDVSADGIYDVLSGFSHPSPSFIDEQLDEVELETHRVVYWDQGLGFTISLASYSHLALFKLTDSVASYMGRQEVLPNSD